MTPIQTARLVHYAQQWASAKHGQKEAVIKAACFELSLSRADVYRKFGEVGNKPVRKQRADAGAVSLTLGDAMYISGALITATRKNGKRIMSVAHAVNMLRANGVIDARRTDPATGELIELSDTAIVRGLRAHKLHPDQLNQPAPVTSMASNHPNHVWQIDASLCVAYYLKKPGEKEAGLQIMDHTVFYKNKPGNLKKIENDTLWRYVITDHTSGWIFVMYVTGGETGINLTNVFITAMQQRGLDPVHGVPLMVMLDPGSANTGAVFKNLCRALQVRVQINKPGNPRAKGQVENANNLVECSFEASLKFVTVKSLEDINEKAAKWMRYFNGKQTHSRHGQTRYASWLTITQQQLRIAPSAEVCRELAVSAPEERKVTPMLTVNYRGTEFKVDTVPGVMVGEKIMIARNAYRENGAQVVLIDADGREIYHVVEPVIAGYMGFPEGAPVIGERYARFADTPAQTNAKTLTRFVTGTDTDTAAAAAIKAKSLPFGGKIDPYKHQDATNMPAYIAKRGTEMGITAPITVIPPMTHIAAAMALVKRGVAMNPERNKQLRDWYPAGVPESELDTIINKFTLRASLRVVTGGVV